MIRYDVAAVLAATDIATTVGEHVRLRPTGKGRLAGKCCFHKEKTPSLYVDTNRRRYRCFGCGASGDVIDFVRELERISFPQAVARLAARAGITPEHLSNMEAEGFRQAARRARYIAQQINDFASGLEQYVETTVSDLSAFLIQHDINPPPILSALHQGLHRLRSATQGEIAELWRGAGGAARRFEEMGRADREHAAAISTTLIDALCVAQIRQGKK